MASYGRKEIPEACGESMILGNHSRFSLYPKISEVVANQVALAKPQSVSRDTVIECM